MSVQWTNGEIKEAQAFKNAQEVGSFICRYGIDPPFLDDVVASASLGEEMLDAIEMHMQEL